MKVDRDHLMIGGIFLLIIAFIIIVVVTLPTERREEMKEDGSLVSASYEPAETKLVYGYHYSVMKGGMKLGWHWKTVPARGEVKIALDSGSKLVSDSATIAERLTKQIESGSRVSVVYDKVFSKAPGEDEKFLHNEIKEVNLLK